MTNKNLNVVIVGGSLAGLMHGIVLKRLGHNVRILNRDAATSMRSQGAGIGARENVVEFLAHHDLSKQPYSILSPEVLFLNREADVIKTWDLQMQATSWNVLYYRLRANFDGLASEYCQAPPKEGVEKLGKAVYDHAKTVTSIKYTDGLVVIEFNDANGAGGTLHADLVIAADGSGSQIRHMLQPSLQRRYAGYVAWRGTVPEQEVSAETKEKFNQRVTYFVKNPGHILLYNIPGKNGSLEPGQRLLNYVWYCNYPEGSPELADLLTDTDGYKHRMTLPKDKMREEVWTRQKAFAKEILPAPFAELVCKTKQPFVQCITDITSPRASFFDGKLLLVGDALATFRPHVAASTNQAALDALLLEKVMKGEMTMQEWEYQVLEYAHLTSLQSITWGHKNQASFFTFLVSAAWYGQALAAQWLRKRWYG